MISIRTCNIYVHCIVGLIIRLLLTFYGEYQDKVSVVQYTDVDYKVFTDAARYVWSNKSPYERHTYRYTPILAFLLIPNIILSPLWGKFLFSFIDVLVGLIIYKLLYCEGHSKATSAGCSLFWLYNPFPIVIASRGNGDAISAAIVLYLLLLIKQKINPFIIGAIYGFAIHNRLYPIGFSIGMYLSMSQLGKSKGKGLFMKIFTYLYPNRAQVFLIFSCISTLIFINAIFYYAYGYKFLYESTIYHLIRKDTRHNFSVYFFMSYLSSLSSFGLWQRFFLFLPQSSLLIILSLMYGSRDDLSFCMLTQSFVMVIYNPVVTSQYFIWFLSLLPVCIPHLLLNIRKVGMLFSLWILAQISWLLPAYMLEFQGYDTFLFIWIQGIVFFSVNIIILGKLIEAYKFKAFQI